MLILYVTDNKNELIVKQNRVNNKIAFSIIWCILKNYPVNVFADLRNINNQVEGFSEIDSFRLFKTVGKSLM